MDAIRWFAPNSYCTLPVAPLDAAGLRIALDGDAPARLAFASDGQCAVAGWEYAARHRCPLVLYLWDLPPWRLGAGRPDHVVAMGGRIRRLPRLTNRYPERAGYYSRIGFVAARAAAVWCPSTATRDDLRRRFGVTAERVPFCYDSDRFNPAHATPSPSGARPVLLAISRLAPYKGHAVIIRAAARMNPRPLVRIIGQGPEAGLLRRLAGQLQVDLELTDTWASDQAIVAAYQTASVVVCPSTFKGFGLTPMEGLAMGRPVVASDIPAHREFLSAAVSWFPPGDDAALAGAVRAALDRPGLPEPPEDLTIEACVARLLPRFARLLGEA